MKVNLKIYLADDHQLVAQGIAGILSKIDGVGEVKVFSEGKKLYEELILNKPDIVFLDYEMPNWNGLYTLEQIKGRFSDLRCYLLSMVNEKSVIERCIQEGASGYLNKDCTVQELTEAVNSENEIYYSKEVLRSLSGVSNVVLPKNDLNQLKLTEREIEVLAYLCDGYSPKEISELIFLSPRTVETHKNNIMQKCDVNSIGKLISIALKNNLV